MNIKWYWSWKNIPELKNMPDSQRKAVYSKYRWRILLHWFHWFGVFLILASWWLFYQLALVLVDNIKQIPILIVCLSLLSGLCGLFYSEILSNTLAHLIRQDVANTKEE